MRGRAHDPLALDDPQDALRTRRLRAGPFQPEGAVGPGQHRGYHGEALCVQHQVPEAVDGGEFWAVPLQHPGDLPAPPGKPALGPERQRRRAHRRAPLLAGEAAVLIVGGRFRRFRLHQRGQGRGRLAATEGNVGAEARMGIAWSEGVVKRGMSLQRFADITSTNAARLFGLDPAKGTIATGSDADLVFIDPDVSKTLTVDDFHVTDYSPWEGWTVSGWPVLTMLRGQVVVDHGKLVGKPGDGRLATARKIGGPVLNGPVL